MRSPVVACKHERRFKKPCSLPIPTAAPRPCNSGAPVLHRSAVIPDDITAARQEQLHDGGTPLQHGLNSDRASDRPSALIYMLGSDLSCW